MNYWESLARIEWLKSYAGANWIREEWHRLATARGRRRSRAGKAFTDLSPPCHPLAFMLNCAFAQLEPRPRGQSAPFSQELSQAIDISIGLRALFEAKVAGLEERKRQLLSKDYDGFEKTVYELAVASWYLSAGQLPSFIETRSGERTPDICLASGVQVECKSPGASRQELANRVRWNEIEHDLSKCMKRARAFYGIRVDSTCNPTPAMVHQIVSVCFRTIKARAEGTTTLDDGTEIRMALLATDGREVRFGDLQLQLERIGAVFQPGEIFFGGLPELRLLGEVDVAKCEWDGPTPPTGFVRDPKLLRFRSGALPTRDVTVRNLVQDARDQFSRDLPAVVYVNYGAIQRGWQESREDSDLKSLAESAMSGTRRINAVALTKGNAMAQGPIWSASALNSRARFPLPDSFYFPN